MIIDILKEAVLGSLNSVFSIAVIIIPIMIILQVLKDYKLLDKITDKFHFLARLFKISKESILSLMVGIIFGLTFGAGVIIQNVKDGYLNKRDLFLITVFLISCHAVFEDTLIFMTVGANGFLLLAIRLITAFIITYLLSKRDIVNLR